MSDEVRCGLCEFFRPKLSDRGRPCPTMAGQCGYEVVWPTLPVAYTMAYNFRLPDRLLVWANTGPCPCFKRKAARARANAPATVLFPEGAKGATDARP